MATPEEDRDELQRSLEADLGLSAPRLGTPPARVKGNAMWVWLGGVAFAVLLGIALPPEEHEVVVWGAVGVWGCLCAAVAFSYERSYWAVVEKARARKRELDLRVG